MVNEYLYQFKSGKSIGGITLDKALYFIRDSWNQVKTQTIKNCFRKSTLLDTHPSLSSSSADLVSESEVVELEKEKLEKATQQLVEDLGIEEDNKILNEFISPEYENFDDVDILELDEEIVEDNKEEEIYNRFSARDLQMKIEDFRQNIEFIKKIPSMNPSDIFHLESIEKKMKVKYLELLSNEDQGIHKFLVKKKKND